MFELLYTSVSPKSLSEPDLFEILDKARLKNKSLGITGMLIYHDREIIQILEGEKNTVKELFQTIFEDRRHTSVDIFYQGEVESRSFTDWSMAFKSLDEGMVEEISAGYEGFNKEISPIGIIKESPNRGKKIFISLRDSV